MRKEFRRLISLDEARSIVLGHLPATNFETVSLERAFGHILDERIVAKVDVPSFDRASMDGYAIRSADSIGAREDRPVALRLKGHVPMGKRPLLEIVAGEAALVSTGSMMPEGSDSVVMVENTLETNGTVLIGRPVHVGENVLSAGSDIIFGEAVIFPGTLLTQREVGVLAALGLNEVTVKKLIVGVASTGDELVPPGDRLELGQIYDINSYTIAAAVKECGGTPVIYGILPDDRSAMEESILKMSDECSLVLVSGSTSAGTGDILYRVLEEIGEIRFHGINLKPGKPTIFGHIRGKPFFGLPGYPTSALTVFGELVSPAIRKVLGRGSHGLKAEGKLAMSLRSEGRRQMLTVGIAGGWVYPVDKGSGSITTLSRADGVIEIPDDVEFMERGDLVEVHLFGDYPAPELLITGEDCPALEVLAEVLPFESRFVFTGTRRGANSLKDGVSDLALISSGATLFPGGICEKVKLFAGGVPFRGYTREIVIIAQDPDLLKLEERRGVTILGWSRESEMRFVQEELLRAKGASEIRLQGSARSHSAVAAAVAAGRVNLGICARAAAERAGLAFSTIGEEEIDFLVAPDRLDRMAVRRFLEALRSEELKKLLPSGFRLHEDTGRMIK